MAKQSMQETLTDEFWRAILHNDAAYDFQFFYAVKTTGIFCWPSCKSRPPKKENVCVYQTAEQAMSANYRPCKRCKPTGQNLPDHEWIASVTDYIDQNYMETLTQENLAEICHSSPFHMHRTFKKVKGMTPVDYIQLKRIGKANELLISSNKAVAAVGQSVGLSNIPYFITLFKKLTGHTPAQYRLRIKKTITEAHPNVK
jgi:AraC family transcriptional regulator of adaptative response / methylphosphotriester-DNA alkyltransferase methyltransferase